MLIDAYQPHLVQLLQSIGRSPITGHSALTQFAPSLGRLDHMMGWRRRYDERFMRCFKASVKQLRKSEQRLCEAIATIGAIGGWFA